MIEFLIILLIIWGSFSAVMLLCMRDKVRYYKREADRYRDMWDEAVGRIRSHKR